MNFVNNILILTLSFNYPSYEGFSKLIYLCCYKNFGITGFGIVKVWNPTIKIILYLVFRDMLVFLYNSFLHTFHSHLFSCKNPIVVDLFNRQGLYMDPHFVVEGLGRPSSFLLRYFTFHWVSFTSFGAVGFAARIHVWRLWISCSLWSLDATLIVEDVEKR